MFAQKRKLLLVLLLMFALVLAACGGGDTADDDSGAVDTSEETSEDTVEEPMTIYIGGLHPLTGGLAADGIQMDTAIQMAIAEINAAGGIKSLGGAQLAYLSADTTGTGEVGQTEAERLISEGAVALIGAFQSSVTTTIAAVSEREGVPLVIDVALSDSILDQGYTYTFRPMANATTVAKIGRAHV